jgi:hypothetical protein
MIASRWSELESVDMESKVFCQNVSEQKLLEYHEDLKKYKAAWLLRCPSWKLLQFNQFLIERHPLIILSLVSLTTARTASSLLWTSRGHTLVLSISLFLLGCL